MGDGTKDNPYTREDVLRLIKENGGTAKGLDLSNKIFKKSIDLKRLDLNGVILQKAILRGAHLERVPLMGAYLKEACLDGAHLEGAYLVEAHLEEVRLRNAHLERALLGDANLEGAHLASAHFEGAYLKDANLEGADLDDAHFERACLVDANLERANLRRARLEGADFQYANLEGTNLTDVRLSSDTKLQNVKWGYYVLAEETHGEFGDAEDTYRRLKQWYTDVGIYDIAGEFFFREMTAQRKRINWWLHPRHRLWSKFVSLICGYGERPLRVIGWGASVILISALIYFIAGSVWSWSAFWSSLYFSVVSFTALGYGSWLQTTNDWIKGIGALESLIGVFSIALFLITFTRKMRR